MRKPLRTRRNSSSGYQKPSTKVLLLGSFPCGKNTTNPRRTEVDILHRLVQPMADHKTIFYQDLRPLFLKADGTMNDLMGPDSIHINAKGQEAWMKVVKEFTSK